MQQPLLESEQKALDFIKNYMKENGFCPSSQEIAEHLHYAQHSTGREVLKRLEDKGYVEIPFKGARRAIRVLGMKFVEDQTP